MKNKILLITAVMIFSTFFLNAQDKKIKVKVVKNEKGEVFTLDTTFESTAYGSVYFYTDRKINQEKIDSLLKSLNIDGEHNVNFICKNLNDLDNEKVKHIWISATGNEEFDIDKQTIIKMIEGDKIIETNDEFTIIKGDSLKIKKEYIYHDGNEHVYKIDKDGKKVIVSTSANSSAYVWNGIDSCLKVITIDDDMDIDVDKKGRVKIISTTSSNEDSKGISEIIIKKGDGDFKTIEVFVNEDEFNGVHKMIELEEVLQGTGEKVKIVKYKTEDGKLVVKAEILDCSLTDDEQKQANKIGLEDKVELELKKFKIYPNPTEGVFNIELELEVKDALLVKVYNQQGKSVYSEKIKKFDGYYSKEIDISKEDYGLYFIKIIQGDKSVTKKIMKK